jgi:hypothetical protein
MLKVHCNLNAFLVGLFVQLKVQYARVKVREQGNRLKEQSARSNASGISILIARDTVCLRGHRKHSTLRSLSLHLPDTILNASLFVTDSNERRRSPKVLATSDTHSVLQLSLSDAVSLGSGWQLLTLRKESIQTGGTLVEAGANICCRAGN